MNSYLPPPDGIPIIVQDWSDGNPIAVSYTLGEHVLNFLPIYKQILHLQKHKGHGAIGLVRDAGGSPKVCVRECSKGFLEEFFRCLAYMVDYMVDFMADDAPRMQKVWMYLLETLQRIAQKLPHKLTAFSGGSVPVLVTCSHVWNFRLSYEATITLMNRMLHAGDPKGKVTSDVIHNSELGATDLRNLPKYRTGPFRNGLKAWQQFLSNGSPGFRVPPNRWEYAEDLIEIPSAEKVCERQVPMGALDIIQNRTERARKFAKALAATIRSRARQHEFMQAFESNTIPLDRPSSYISLSGHPTVLQPFYPRPSPITPWQSPDDVEVPETNLWQKEFVAARLRGHDAIPHPLGDNHFQMMIVTSKAIDKDADGDAGGKTTKGKTTGGKTTGGTHKPIVSKRVLDKTFDQRTVYHNQGPKRKRKRISWEF